MPDTMENISGYERRLSPPASCVMHEAWLRDIREDLFELKLGQERSTDKISEQLEDFKTKTEEQIFRLWNNGLKEMGLRVVDLGTRVTSIEVRDEVEGSIVHDNDSTLKTLVKSIPREAWLLAAVALIVWGPQMVSAIGAMVGG